MVSFDWQLVDNLNDQIHVIRQSHYTVYTVIEILQLFTGWPNVSKYKSADFCFCSYFSTKRIYCDPFTYSQIFFLNFDSLKTWESWCRSWDPEMWHKNLRFQLKSWEFGRPSWALRGDGSNLWSQHIFWRK